MDINATNWGNYKFLYKTQYLWHKVKQAIYKFRPSGSPALVAFRVNVKIVEDSLKSWVREKR
jgi:hypothetical protein